MDLHTGWPFWPVRDGLPASYPPLDSDTSADVAIVGAGITGALAAVELAAAGAKVVVIDRDDVAAGSSAATSGLLLYDTDSSFRELSERFGPSVPCRVYTLGLEAIDRLEALCRTLSHGCGFTRRPSLYLASRRRDVRSLRREFADRQNLRLEVELMERRDIEARYSFSAPAAIYSQGTAEIDCYRLVHALLERAAGNGARIYDRTAMTGLRASSGIVTVSTGRGPIIRARRVVLATGYDTGLGEPRGGRYQLASTWCVVTEPLDSFDGWTDRCLIWETARPYFYLRSTDDGRLLVGGEDEPYPQRHRRKDLLASKADVLLARARRMFPQLALEPAYAWAGTFATTEDGLPFIGDLASHPGVSIALAYGGNGITFGAIAAMLIRDAYLGRRHPDAAIFVLPR
jgi:glycine/D-amino acid oxidase-like deaminating enzyme